MNDATRKDIANEIDKIYADNGFANIADDVRQLADDEREKIDNLTEEFGENAPQLEPTTTPSVSAQATRT